MPIIRLYKLKKRFTSKIPTSIRYIRFIGILGVLYKRNRQKIKRYDLMKSFWVSQSYDSGSTENEIIENQSYQKDSWPKSYIIRLFYALSNSTIFRKISKRN